MFIVYADPTVEVQRDAEATAGVVYMRPSTINILLVEPHGHEKFLCMGQMSDSFEVGRIQSECMRRILSDVRCCLPSLLKTIPKDTCNITVGACLSMFLMGRLA